MKTQRILSGRVVERVFVNPATVAVYRTAGHALAHVPASAAIVVAELLVQMCRAMAAEGGN